ncbi:LOW QUALITY PROTEIN: hypothetical protein CVT25_013096 [Psilocybe cyanescens]|uniref:Uncharacterized protein n=1 Tax=Psilocybe cyanescens TaxID=93625 RepID=A0A409XHR0_PSICY|nr:LOW QUALITY PROTEIN: hypothetical protein CVT25_013096 [Psilocybe cyanescens]
MAPFKFTSKPPPLPPKDAVYQLRNTQQSSSRVSLVPDSPVPSSPSVQYATRRANSPFAADSMINNNSASDLLSPQDNRSSAPKKGLAFLKFPKRSPKSPPPPPDTPILVIANDEPDPPPPEEDDGISLPWNFQHNIHVDEGSVLFPVVPSIAHPTHRYVGLPPSWSTSLAAAGFTNEEITAIQDRRAGGMRSPPDLRYLYNERPQSPAALAFPQPSTSSTVPILTHPTPRTTSLPRLVPLASSSSAPSPPSASDLPPPLPAQPSSTSTPSLPTPQKRVPPPKRKPPTPYEDLPNTTASAPGHKPNQASSSTIGNSSDSHASSSNHHANQTANTTFANMSISAAYAVNPPVHPYSNPNTNPAYASLSYSNPALNRVLDISNQNQDEGDEDDTRQQGVSGSSNGNGNTHTTGASMSLAGGGSMFRVVNGDRDRGSGSSPPPKTANTTTTPDEKPASKPSIWGTRISGTKSKDSTSASASASVSGHSDTAHAASSSSSHLPSTSTSGSAQNHSQTSTWKTTPTSSLSHAAASASSSLAHASSVVARQSSNLVEAVKGRIRAGKRDKERDKDSLDVSSENGGEKKGKSKSKSRERGRGRSKSRERGAGADDAEEAKEVDSDEEFVSLPAVSPDAVVAGFGAGGAGAGEGRTPVWQIYSRPRAGTDASASAGHGGRVGASASASQHSLASSRHAPSASASGNVSANVSRKPSVARSLKSAASQGSLRSRFGRFANGASNAPNGNTSASLSNLQNQNQSSRSVGSLHSTRNGSVTSLESIPEGERYVPPMPEDAREVARSGSVRRPGQGQTTYIWSPPNASAVASSSASSSPHVNGSGIADSSYGYDFSASSSTSAEAAAPAPAPTTKRTAALPPRLSLHQSKDSTDLSSWSEALLSGISLSGDGDGGLGLSFGLGSDWEKGLNLGSSLSERDKDKDKEREKARQRERERDSPTTVTTATVAATARPWERQIQPPPVQVQQQASSQQAQPPTVRKLPTSKPPPSIPIPPILAHQRARSGSRSGPTLPLPAPPVGAASAPPSLPPIPTAPTTTTPPAPAPTCVRSPTGLLSPPPSAWATAGLATSTTTNSNGEPTTVFSPGASSAGPDSAQLWNEIEQMMDPGMISAIPGLHLSVALPLGAQDALKSAGVGPTPALTFKDRERDGSTKEGENSVQTVRDVVGSSPVYEVEAGRKVGNGEDEDEDDGSIYDDEEAGEQELEVYESIEVDEAEEELYGGYLEDETPDIQLRLAEDNNNDDDIIATTTTERSTADADTHARLLDAPPHMHSDRDPNRDSSRSSSSTLTVTALAAATIVRNVSVARRAGAYVMDKSRATASLAAERARERHNEAQARAQPASPLSSHFGGGSGGGGSEESTGSSSTSSSRDRSSQELQPTPTTDGGLASPLLYYLDGVQTPSPTPDKISFELGQHSHGPPLSSMSKAAAWSREQDEDEDEAEFAGYPDEETMEAEALAAAAASPGMVPRPTIVISDAPLSSHCGSVTSSGITPETSTPLSPFQRYRGWLSDVVAPLEEFIDEAVDPREHYLDLREIAEGESGSVFAALLNPTTAHKLRLPPLVKAQDADEVINARPVMVAIKSVAIVPSGSPKLVDLQRELSLMRGLGHENVLGMDGVYVDLVEDSLWVRMELMERSLADIIALVGDGLQLQERTIARFASDVLCALEFLQKHNISHRDVRSDNLLLNKNGVLKLADFSNAVQVTPGSSMRSDAAGVVFWQAPEVPSIPSSSLRANINSNPLLSSFPSPRPPYDALKVDVWSLGATVWEMAQQDPPFADTQQFAERWPPLRQPELYSPAFHDFLRKCSEPAAVRPSPSELLKFRFHIAFSDLRSLSAPKTELLHRPQSMRPPRRGAPAPAMYGYRKTRFFNLNFNRIAFKTS